MKLVQPLMKGQIARYRRTAGPVPPEMMSFPTVLLTTVGARTGVERTHVLGGFPDGPDAWLICGSKSGAATHPGWFTNLAKNPDKIWLEVGQEEQEKRFKARIDDPIRQWKLSPMDVESYGRWYDYSRARDMMFEHTDTDHAPWHIVHSDDKKRARLNAIAHILSQIPYKKVDHAKVKLPARSDKKKYDDRASIAGRRLAEQRY